MPRVASHAENLFHTKLVKTIWLIMLALLWKTPCLASETAACNPDSLQNSAEVKKCFDYYEKVFPSAAQERTDVLVRLARLSFMRGELSGQGEKKKFFEKGKSYAEMLIRETPGGVEGHYWRALNLAGLAENSSKLKAFRLLPKILKELDKAVKIDPSYDQAGPHRVLGRIYYEAPGRPISVGNLPKSIRHLEEAVRLAPKNSTNHLFLGEAYLKSGERQRARKQLEQVLQATQNNLLPQSINNDRSKAERLLAKYGKKE